MVEIGKKAAEFCLPATGKDTPTISPMRVSDARHRLMTTIRKGNFQTECNRNF